MELFRKLRQLNAEHQLRRRQLWQERKNKENCVRNESYQARAAIKAARLENGLRVHFSYFVYFATRNGLLAEVEEVYDERATVLRKQFRREVDELIDSYSMLLGKVWIELVGEYIGLVLPIYSPSTYQGSVFGRL